MRIYLDVCCLNRPFDDQSQTRIRLETEAIDFIIDACASEKWTLISSFAIDYEIAQNTDETRRKQVRDLVILAKERIKAEEALKARSKELVKLGLKDLDATHVACAERAKADAFLTTDDKLLKKADQHKDKIQVHIANPLNWLMEAEGDTGNEKNSHDHDHE